MSSDRYLSPRGSSQGGFKKPSSNQNLSLEGRPQRPPEMKVAGLSAVSALFKAAPDRVLRLFYDDKHLGEVGDFCALMARTRKPYRKVEGEELSRIAGTVLHGGVVAIAEPKAETHLTLEGLCRLAVKERVLFLLDGVGNPHNVGAIARSLAFFGWGSLILSDHPGQAGLSDAAYRVAEGGLDHLEIYRVKELRRLLMAVKPGMKVIGTALGSDPLKLDRLAQDPVPKIILLGHEETGLSKGILDVCDLRLTLEGSGALQSLNVSATAAILAYGLQRPA